MSETPSPDDETTRDGPSSADTPLRRILATATTSLLTDVVERFWQDRGCRTARTDRDGHRFVLVRDDTGEPVHLVWIDPEAVATPSLVDRFERMAASFGDVDATLTSGRDYDDAVYAAADEHGIECLASEQLVTLVSRAGLREAVRHHRRSSSPGAVADGGAPPTPARERHLGPAADHPLPLRGALVGGGAALALLALWGGAARLTAQLQTCGGQCPLVWAASFLPVLAMLVGVFAVVVGLFD